MSEDPTNLEEPAVSLPVEGEALPPLGASWQEQDGLLREMWMQNKTPQQIGEVLGRSVPAIMTRAARLGLPRRSAPGRKPGAGSVRRVPLQASGTGSDNRRVSASAGQGADAPVETSPQASVRICLMCLRKFESAGRHNRICSPCKGSSEYHQASALPDAQLPQA